VQNEVLIIMTDIDPLLETDLTEEYAAEAVPNDGEFYYHIRFYQGAYNGAVDPFLENRWWARINTCSKPTRDQKGSYKRKYIKRIIRNGRFMDLFDQLVRVPGLRHGMKLGMIQTMFSLWCHEVRHKTYIWNRKLICLGMHKLSRMDTKFLGGFNMSKR
jgi:hypothetical protein